MSEIQQPECQNDCGDGFVFPQPIRNHGGLEHIGYRIGVYGDFLRDLLRGLDQSLPLQGWTYRGTDDPAIALLEGAAILGDILTFYQELYANEAYLPTARWRESIADLVRLLGYRPAPGLGGRGVFALEIRGAEPVTVPAGLALKAQLTGQEQPAEFETDSELTAYPGLSKFHLYRGLQAPAAVPDRLNCLEVESPQSVTFKPGDRILLDQAPAEILIVQSVQQQLGRTILTVEGRLVNPPSEPTTAYRIGRSFRHFGHNAPPKLSMYDDTTTTADTTTTDDTTPTMKQANTEFWRLLNPVSKSKEYPAYYSSLKAEEMPLERQVDDIRTGTSLICQGYYYSIGLGETVPFVRVREIHKAEPDSLTWGNLTAGVTMLTLKEALFQTSGGINSSADIRKMIFHEVTSPELTLRVPQEGQAGDFPEPELYFYGTHAEATALAERSLLLKHADGRILHRRVTTTADEFLLNDRDRKNQFRWKIALDGPLAPFKREDFDEQNPHVMVYGNLVTATQGKSEREAVLGNGDSRQAFQTFSLPKTPLTYRLSAGSTPPQTPELVVRVQGREWRRVESLFGRGPEDEVYIVREDVEGCSWVQFGDGKTGKRLPSGVRNVTAQYRTGSGAYGTLKAGATVQAANPVERLDKVLLPDVISGGARPESGQAMRAVAPGRVQGLNRLVGLQDYETEAQSIPGVTLARAKWGLVDNIPSITVWVLMENGRAAEFEQVQQALQVSDRCRGLNRYPLRVQQGKRRYVRIQANVSFDPALQEETVKAAIQAALGAGSNTGLFALAQRRFGQMEYATRVTALIQGVEGVRWAHLTELQYLPYSDDPAAIPPPPAVVLMYEVHCADDLVLSLFPEHLSLNPVSGPAEEC